MAKPLDKIAFLGTIESVQPRIRLTRSFDQRNHTYQGFLLRIVGEAGAVRVAVGEAAHQKHRFRAGDRVRGQGLPVADPRTEVAELYRVSGLEVLERGPEEPGAGPPYLGTPPPLPVYRERGHRRLDPGTYDASCSSCIWGCRMAVELIIDQWNPGRMRYRQETFCYGPLSCPLYRSGPTRKVPGRKGMSFEEEDWVDEEAVGHRGRDE